MEIIHSEHGILIVSGERRLQLVTATVTKPNVLLNRNEMVAYCDAVHKFNLALGRVPDYAAASSPTAKDALTIEDLRTSDTFVKYVSKEDLENFIRKGKFQFGTIEYYQRMENERARDGHEGYANLFLNVNGSHVITSAFSGFNYLIFCGTSSSNSETHKEVFGECRLSIRDINSFCEAVQQAVGANSYFVGRVQYDNSKIYESPPLSIPSFSPSNLFTEEMVDQYRKYSFLPSLFVKPAFFQHEDEIRIVFEMSQDQNRPKQIERPRLLSFLDING